MSVETTQKRKGTSSNKPREIAKLLPFPDRGELELSQPPSTSERHANTVSAKPDLRQFFHFPNTFLHFPLSQNPVIDFLTTARDLKKSFQGVTVPQPTAKIVAQTLQQRYLPNQNLTSPISPTPIPINHIPKSSPIPPNDIIVVSKTQRHYTDTKTHQKAISSDFSNVYYHFHQACLSRHNTLFTPQLLVLPPEIKSFLLPEYILYLQSCGINI